MVGTAELENHLGDKRYVTVVLRLLVDAHNGLIYGEIVDQAPVRPSRFLDWGELSRRLQDWLTDQD